MEFVTRDATGQIVWLESGNATAGLGHILRRHSEDFSRKYLYNGKEYVLTGIGSNGFIVSAYPD